LLWNNLKYLATLCYKDGQFDKSIRVHGTALELVEQNLGQEHPLYSDILDKIALNFCSKKDFVNAQEYSQKALKLRKMLMSEEDVIISKSYMTLGKVAADMGDYAQALAYYEKALYIREMKIDENKSAVADTWRKIAQLFEHQGAYEAAAFLYEFTLQIRNSCFSIKNDADISLMKALAQVRAKQEEYPRAVLVCLEMEEIANKLYGKQHPKYAVVLKYLGVAYQKSGDLAVAGKYLEEALTIQRESLDEDNPIYIQTLEAFAEVCFQRGDCTRAIQLYKERHDVNFEETSEERREAACTLLAIGNCYLKLGEKEKAKAYFVEAEGKIKRSRILANEKYNQLKEIYANGKNGKFQISKSIRKRMRDGERRSLEESISFLIQVYKTKAEKMENENIKKAYVAFSLGEMYQRLAKKDEAIYWYTVAEKESEPEYYVRTCIRLGEAYLQNGEEEKAFRKFINAKEYIAEYGDKRSPAYFKLLGLIGDYFFKKGEKETALDFYHSWNQLHKELDLPDCVFYDNKIEKMGKILTALERNQEAADQYYTLAMSIRNREGETEKYAKMLLRVAMLYINLGDAKEAEPLLDHVLILAGKSGITSERFGKFCDKVGRLYNAARMEEKALEALKLAYFQEWHGKKCITKEGLQLLLELLWKNSDFKTFFSIKNGSKME